MAASRRTVATAVLVAVNAALFWPTPTFCGRVFAVGGNQNGQLGDRSRSDRQTGLVVRALSDRSHGLASSEVTHAVDPDRGSGLIEALDNKIIQIAASSGASLADQQGYSLFLTRDGRVLASGSNPFFALIESSTTDMPVYINSIGNDIVLIAAGRTHSLFLKRNGTVLGVGFNCCGQLGTAQGTGAYLRTPTAVPIADPVVHMDTNQAGFHSLFVTAGRGLVMASGQNSEGQLGSGALTNSYTASAMLDAAGRQLQGIKVAVAGSQHSVLLSTAGQVYAVGANSFGQLGLNEGTGQRQLRATRAILLPLQNIVHVAAGDQHTLLVSDAGQVYVFGSNSFGQLGSGAPTSGSGHYTDRPSLLVDRWNSPIGPKTHNVTHVAAGAHTSFFRTRDGVIFAAGANWKHQLGTGLTNPAVAQYSLPTAVSTESIGIAKIAAGGSHTLFLALECENLPGPCTNDASCSNAMLGDPAESKFSFTCGCTPGFTHGICAYNFIQQYAANCNVSRKSENPSDPTEGTCWEDVDECASSPCVHGTCDDSTSCLRKKAAHDADASKQDETYVPDKNCERPIVEDVYRCLCDDFGVLGGWTGVNCTEEVPVSTPFFIAVGTVALIFVLAMMYGAVVFYIRSKEAKELRKSSIKLNRVAPAP